jgi:hypothetical protein
MSVTSTLTRWGGARLSRRLAVSVPYFGAAVALLTLGYAIRRKGVLRGSLDTGLNAVPFVGATKNLVELWRGRDFFDDRRPAAARDAASPDGGRPAERPARPSAASRLRRARL